MRRSRLTARLFQSTLPRGSDFRAYNVRAGQANFNPRSLAGATWNQTQTWRNSAKISIHAPSRERLQH